MNLFLNKTAYFYEMENVCRLFFPHLKFEKNPDETEGDYAKCEFIEKDGVITAYCTLFYEGKELKTQEDCPQGGDEREEEITMARGLYRLMEQATGLHPNWGILTGVRPGKLYSSLFHEYGLQEKAEEYMNHRLWVEPNKIALCHQTYVAEQKAQSLSSPNAFSLYISIPFCPTRCSYCSFVSHSVEKTAKMVPQYVELLCEELAETARIAKELGLSLKTVYFGGGTPTQLTADQLDTVLTAVEKHFDLSQLLEYTVEGGRPDTITPEKLKVLKEHGVDRLSINPQTMHDHVLETIGRRHTAQQVVDAFAMAREAGFDNINMDVIAGLPGDSFEGFCSTLQQLLALHPENITVHTLSIKRSSFLTADGGVATVPTIDTVEKMLDYASDVLTQQGFSPYYLYRQSKMLGNLENVGWSLTGKDCLYNIYMMNELHTVLAAGAGAVIRLKDPHSGQIERIFNFKYPYEYNERFSTILERKQGIFDFYKRYPL